MRAVALLLSIGFLLPPAVSAQTVDPNELTYGPFASFPRDPSLAIAVAKHGLLLGWPEVDPGALRPEIRTALLSFDAQLTGPINTVPSYFEDHHASGPAIATDGDRFFVAWIERDPYTYEPRRSAGVFTDANGSPIEDTRLFGRAVDPSPAVIWDGVAFRLYGDASYSISPAGKVTSIRGEAARRVPFATAEANGWVEWSNTRTQPYLCLFRCSGPRPWYALDWTIVTAKGIRSGRINQTGYISEKPGVAANGSDLLVVWTTGEGLAGVRIEDGDAGRVFGLRCDAEGDAVVAGSLAVFESHGDIFGVTIDGETFGTPFPISAGGEWDTRPRVFEVGAGRFLVTYVREHTTAAVSLAGRFVHAP